jgi:hypothetical protein
MCNSIKQILIYKIKLNESLKSKKKTKQTNKQLKQLLVEQSYYDIINFIFVSPWGIKLLMEEYL